MMLDGITGPTDYDLSGIYLSHPGGSRGIALVDRQYAPMESLRPEEHRLPVRRTLRGKGDLSVRG